MKIEKHMEILKEVETTIKDALSSHNILSYQRRLVSMLSLGAQQLIEVYFHKLKVIRPGTQVKHEWFGMSERNLNIKISSILTTKSDKIPELREVLILAKHVESNRNDLLYGSPIVDDKLLREKIDAFLELKKIIEL